MKISIRVFDSGGVECRDERCKFARTCASHASAGDYRSESGFTPELVTGGSLRRDDTIHHEVECKTFDRPTHKDDRTYPENYSELKRGMIVLNKNGYISTMNKEQLTYFIMGMLQAFDPIGVSRYGMDEYTDYAKRLVDKKDKFKGDESVKKFLLNECHFDDFMKNIKDQGERMWQLIYHAIVCN